MLVRTLHPQHTSKINALVDGSVLFEEGLAPRTGSNDRVQLRAEQVKVTGL